ARNEEAEPYIFRGCFVGPALQKQATPSPREYVPPNRLVAGPSPPLNRYDAIKYQQQGLGDIGRAMPPG
ncbi:hypothetical protein ACFL0Q_02335, partial [Thermodesulfobacteriota bacterium]